MLFSRIDAIGLSPGWIRELHLPVVLVSVRPEPGKSENAVRRRGRASARGGFQKPRSLHPGLPEPPAARRPPLILPVTGLPVTLVFIPSVLLSCWASPRSSCPLRAAPRGRGRSTPLVVAGPCAACPRPCQALPGRACVCRASWAARGRPRNESCPSFAVSCAQSRETPSCPHAGSPGPTGFARLVRVGVQGPCH